MRLANIFALCAALLLLPACATKKHSTNKSVTDTATTDTRVNNTHSDVTKVKPREITMVSAADSAEAAFQLPKGTKLVPLANVAGRKAEVASVEVDTAGILRVRCKCNEEQLKETIYELERTVFNMKDSVSRAQRERREAERKLEVVQQKPKLGDYLTGVFWMLVAIVIIWVAFKILKRRAWPL